MLDLMKEGWHYVVFFKHEGNTLQMSFSSFNEVENFIATQKDVYKVVSFDVCDIPLDGLKLAS